MCLHHRSKEADFALKDKKPEDWMVGYKVLEAFSELGIITPYRGFKIDLSLNVLESDVKDGGLQKRDRIIRKGIHFFKTKYRAKQLAMYFSSGFVVPVYVQVKDIIGVGVTDVVAKKVYFLDKTLKNMQRKLKNV